MHTLIVSWETINEQVRIQPLTRCKAKSDENWEGVMLEKMGCSSIEWDLGSLSFHHLTKTLLGQCITWMWNLQTSLIVILIFRGEHPTVRNPKGESGRVARVLEERATLFSEFLSNKESKWLRSVGDPKKITEPESGTTQALKAGRNTTWTKCPMIALMHSLCNFFSRSNLGNFFSLL